MTSWLDPKLDVVFKILFADPSNKDLLLSLLSAVLRPSEPIVNADVLNPDLPKELAGDKGIVLDLRLKLSGDRYVDVEMQSDPRQGVRKRALYYWARMYGQQLFRGMEYTALEPCVSIFFMGYSELPGKRFHSIFRVLEVHDQELYGDQLELHMVELPKVPGLAGAAKEAEDPEGQLAAWGTFLRARSEEALQELAMMNPVFEKAKKALEALSGRPDVQEIARQRELALLTYKLELGEARAAGKAEGKAEALVLVLERRFGKLPSDLLTRVGEAKTAQLEAWLDRAVDGGTLDAVFDPPSQH